MDTESLLAIIEPLVEAQGLALVELSVGRHHGDTQVRLVLHKDGGISLDDLTSAQKVIRPRLELDIDRENLSLEMSSPGSGRVFKDSREYRLFSGQKAKILVDDRWIEGTIIEADKESVTLDVEGQEESYSYHLIRKGKLD